MYVYKINTNILHLLRSVVCNTKISTLHVYIISILCLVSEVCQ